MALSRIASQALKLLPETKCIPQLWSRKFAKEFDLFQIAVDVRPFKEKDLSITTQDQATIVVQGRQEERKGNSFITRTFSKLYVLPKGHKFFNVESHVEKDGLLTITAEIHPSHTRHGN